MSEEQADMIITLLESIDSKLFEIQLSTSSIDSHTSSIDSNTM